jgi:hypothetical protein
MIRFALALSVCAGAAQAQAVKLRGDEIGFLLTGNTAVGLWEGNAYRQYFDPDGSTIYAQEGARSARGTWRVEGEEYQSRWPDDTEWEGWFVMEYAGQWFWASKKTPPTPFDVIEGQQLVAQ